MSGSGTASGVFRVVVMSDGKNAVFEKKTWRNKEVILHFVSYTVHDTLCRFHPFFTGQESP
jgi:hypothetical protein